MLAAAHQNSHRIASTTFPASHAWPSTCHLQPNAWLRRTTLVRAIPSPSVAEPPLRQHMNRCRLCTTIVNRRANQNVVRRILGILDNAVKIVAVIEHTQITQLQLRFQPIALAVTTGQLLVGKLTLRILVKSLHVRVRGGRIDIKVNLFHIFAMVALWSAQPVQALLEDVIPRVPKRKRKTEPTFTVADPQQTIFTPTISRLRAWSCGK